MAKVIIFHTPVRFGGGERQLVLLGKEFLLNKLDFIIVNLAKSEEFENALKQDNIPFLTIKNKYLGDTPSKKDYLKHLLTLLLQIFNNELKNLWSSAHSIWANDFPANFFVYFLIKIYGGKNKKLICFRHSYKNPEKGIFKKIYQNVLNTFDVIIGVSEYVSNSLKTVFPEIKDKIIFIPHGMDTSLFEISKSKLDIRKELNLPLEDILGIYLARFASPKNHLFLIKVLKEVNNFKIILGGDGEMRDKFLEEVKANSLEDRVIYKGHIENNLVPLYLLASDFCIFPSKVEGFGIAILEAMASGLSVIIFDSVYSKAHGPHVLVAKSEDDFIQYVKNVINDKNLREKLGKLNKEYVKNNLDIKMICHQLIQILS